MAVTVREKVKGSNEWWIFINHQGKRRSKKIGDKRTANKVAKEIRERLAKGEMVDLDAIVSAMLTLGGKQALQQVETRLLKSEVSLSAKRAAVDALRFHAEQGEVFEKQTVIEIYRGLLQDPKTADFVVEDLARWKDWEALDQVLVLWETRDKNTWLRYPIGEYLKACPLPRAKQQIGMDSVAGGTDANVR